jgi:hypothetical protein
MLFVVLTILPLLVEESMVVRDWLLQVDRLKHHWLFDAEKNVK